MYVRYLHISTHTGYRVYFSFYYTGIYVCTNIDDAIPLPGHNYYCLKNKLYATQCNCDVLTIYPYHSVNSMDTWYLVFSMMLVLYLVSPGPLASVYIFYRFVFSLSFYRYRYRYAEIVGTVFLIVSFPNDNSKTFGTISIPTIFLSTFLTVLV